MLRWLSIVFVLAVVQSGGAAEPALDGGAADLPYESLPEELPFKIAPREGRLWHYPCLKCHADMKPNPQERKLVARHLDELDHGRDRIWCLDCHDAENRNVLRTVSGEQIDFDQAWIICGACHAKQQRDWYYGAHGKRVGNWQGERIIYNCTHCHDPHEPAIEARAPLPPPPVRAGLERQHHTVTGTHRIWERVGDMTPEGSREER